jgi:hypothetical protein
VRRLDTLLNAIFCSEEDLCPFLQTESEGLTHLVRGRCAAQWIAVRRPTSGKWMGLKDLWILEELVDVTSMRTQQVRFLGTQHVLTSYKRWTVSWICGVSQTRDIRQKAELGPS